MKVLYGKFCENVSSAVYIVNEWFDSTFCLVLSDVTGAMRMIHLCCSSMKDRGRGSITL